MSKDKSNTSIKAASSLSLSNRGDPAAVKQTAKNRYEGNTEKETQVKVRARLSNGRYA